jgi:hypothetical protein
MQDAYIQKIEKTPRDEIKIIMKVHTLATAVCLAEGAGLEQRDCLNRVGELLVAPVCKTKADRIPSTWEQFGKLLNN